MIERGFSLVELLIATMMSALLIGALVAAMRPARAAFEATPAVLELQQQSRVGMEFLAGAIRSAGTQRAAHRPSSIAASVIPGLIPVLASGAGGDFSEVEVFRQVAPGAFGVLQQDQATAGALMILVPGLGCSRLPDVCGFVAGTIAAIADGQGRFDTFEIAAVDPAHMSVTPLSPLSGAYRKGTQLFESELLRFSLASQPDGSKSLTRTSGAGRAQPIVDGVNELAITLWAEAAAPKVTWDGADGWASYGPPPPDAAFRDVAGSWPAGESCAFSRDPAGPHSRLTDLGSAGTLVQLARSDLSDGPWCTGGAPGSYDADLMRVRRVDVSIRLESLAAGLRGPAGQFFRRPGSSASSPIQWVPDRIVTMSLYLRNQR